MLQDVGKKQKQKQSAGSYQKTNNKRNKIKIVKKLKSQRSKCLLLKSENKAQMNANYV